MERAESIGKTALIFLAWTHELVEWEWGSGCSTAVKRVPCEQKVLGSNPPWLFSLLFLGSFSLKRRLARDKQSLVNMKSARQCFS